MIKTVAATILAIALVLGPAAQACVDTASTIQSVFVRIMPNGDIVHGQDAALHIPGLEFVPGAGGAAARDQIMQEWAGRQVNIAVVTPADRWGRKVGLVTSITPATEQRADLGAELLAAGGYMMTPENVPSECLAAWRKAERQALDNRAGIWGQTPSSLLSSTAPDGASLGQKVVIRGRISSVGVRSARVYINFGGPGTGAATASMSPLVWRKLAQSSLVPETLRGRQAVVRGHVASITPRWMVNIDHASAIEIE